MSAIEVRDLKKSFATVKALGGLKFNVGEGNLYGLIGPDGAGKSTFMRIAVCLLMQDEGSVTIMGNDTVKKAADIKRRIGYMPQHFSLYPDLTVHENLVFFANLFGIGKKERTRHIEKLLDFSRLGPFLSRRAENLSGGMKQKLALSCALVHTPDVLFLDEPTTGVDPVSRREFWKILAEIKNGGTTILVSTPYMDEAEKCDNVGFIMNGELILEDRPDRLPDRFSAQILDVRAPNIVKRSRSLVFPDIVTGMQTFGDRIHLTVADANEAIPDIEAFLEKNGIENVLINRTAPSVEDVFMERTQ